MQVGQVDHHQVDQAGRLLEQARPVVWLPGSITLAFPSKFNAEQAERASAEIAPAVSAALGKPTRVVFTVASRYEGESAGDSQALAADKKNRETEARQHPMIRRVQDVFGASLREIKT